MLEHGGRLQQAVIDYAIPLDNWIDLSTGINPKGWPVPPLPASSWLRLPEENDALEQAARDYYGVEDILVVAGSQAAIQVLPSLFPAQRVAVLNPSYAEHAHAWQRAGHDVTMIDERAVEELLPNIDSLVLIHPNNPTGACFSQQQLLDWHEQLATRGGCLVIDEAFIDCANDSSMAVYSARRGLIVLRSLGKFFGLAGARVGFVCAHAELLAQLRLLLGPWAVSGPARWVASRALEDRAWQHATRQRLKNDGARLATLLTRHKLPPDGGCHLFKWIRTPHAEDIHKRLAEAGIFTRLFSAPASLRFGLPANNSQWQRLDEVLRYAITDDLFAINA